MESKIKLNLGCADSILPGYINVDRTYLPGVTVADLEQRWPWPDGHADEILANDIIEHLKDKIHTMNEMHRVLRFGGLARICVPSTNGTGAFQDPTHVSYWNERSFVYYEFGSYAHDRFSASYGITASFLVVSLRVEQTPADGPRVNVVLQKA